ncbi:MAG TPA: SOS response-associated peptidase [Opitutaceae bacterium]|nr:SOS response-associated peptidase [Opitutaceae bacterium]
MCSRYMLVSPADLLAKATGMRVFPLVNPRYNAAPTQNLPVVRSAGAGAGRESAIMRWGLVPSWSREGSMKSVLINARSETVMQKPAFRDAFRRRRCLVPADGFFEWKHAGRDRIPWLFEAADGGPITFAGLWETWAGGAGGSLDSFTILTTTPNEVVADFHNRMPVILPAAARDAWLADDAGEETLMSLLKPVSASTLRARPVNPRLNSVANDDPSCIDPPPAGPAPGAQLGFDFPPAG